MSEIRQYKGINKQAQIQQRLFTALRTRGDERGGGGGGGWKEECCDILLSFTKWADRNEPALDSFSAGSKLFWLQDFEKITGRSLCAQPVNKPRESFLFIYLFFLGVEESCRFERGEDGERFCGDGGEQRRRCKGQNPPAECPRPLQVSRGRMWQS